MLGDLPRTLDVGGQTYRIRTDYRSVLRIIAALADDELMDAEKAYVLLRQVYIDFDRIPADKYVEAYEKACGFIACGQPDTDRKQPQVVNWIKDEQMLFPAINKVAGREVRAAEYLHWWTFMGFFHGISSEDTYGYVLMLRQKKARGKKLEKHEQEFWDNNRQMCEYKQRPASSSKLAEATAADIFAQLLAEQKQAEQEG